MPFHKPIWKAEYGPLFVRIPMGLYFLAAGRTKMTDLEAFIHTVKQFNILPDQLATLYGVTLPYMEIVIGIFLIVGIWTTLAAGVASFLLGSFIYAVGLFPNNPNLFNKDIMLLGACMGLLASGAGAFSIDSFRKSG